MEVDCKCSYFVFIRMSKTHIAGLSVYYSPFVLHWILSYDYTVYTKTQLLKAYDRYAEINCKGLSRKDMASVIRTTKAYGDRSITQAIFDSVVKPNSILW